MYRGHNQDRPVYYNRPVELNDHTLGRQKSTGSWWSLFCCLPGGGGEPTSKTTPASRAYYEQHQERRRVQPGVGHQWHSPPAQNQAMVQVHSREAANAVAARPACYPSPSHAPLDGSLAKQHLANSQPFPMRPRPAKRVQRSQLHAFPTAPSRGTTYQAGVEDGPVTRSIHGRPQWADRPAQRSNPALWPGVAQQPASREHPRAQHFFPPPPRCRTPMLKAGDPQAPMGTSSSRTMGRPAPTTLNPTPQHGLAAPAMMSDHPAGASDKRPVSPPVWEGRLLARPERKGTAEAVSPMGSDASPTDTVRSVSPVSDTSPSESI